MPAWHTFSKSGPCNCTERFPAQKVGWSAHQVLCFHCQFSKACAFIMKSCNVVESLYKRQAAPLMWLYYKSDGLDNPSTGLSRYGNSRTVQILSTCTTCMILECWTQICLVVWRNSAHKTVAYVNR
ncbi:uncharacterized protein LOC131256808 [Magnolia sinica]|uniref:uncharacterized protein LOC131256808 n=1 Tax=Magnolia sinica TaxID=86752 RepID=UPI00265B4805|nr:uncharacterized protein LOC131256808 [Magnolia sinica]